MVQWERLFAGHQLAISPLAMFAEALGEPLSRRKGDIEAVRAFFSARRKVNQIQRRLYGIFILWTTVNLGYYISFYLRIYPINLICHVVCIRPSEIRTDPLFSIVLNLIIASENLPFQKHALRALDFLVIHLESFQSQIILELVSHRFNRGLVARAKYVTLSLWPACKISPWTDTQRDFGGPV